MSIRREFDYYEEVDALRDKLEELATQARADALDTESFSEALTRRLERGHAPRVAVNTGGAAAREPPPEDESDVSSESEDNDDKSPQEDEPDNAKILSADEGDDGKLSTVENSENVLSEDELDTIFLKNDEIKDEIATIGRLLERGLSADDLNHVIRREKELLAELREMREKLRI